MFCKQIYVLVRSLSILKYPYKLLSIPCPYTSHTYKPLQIPYKFISIANLYKSTAAFKQSTQLTWQRESFRRVFRHDCRCVRCRLRHELLHAEWGEEIPDVKLTRSNLPPPRKLGPREHGTIEHVGQKLYMKS